MADSFQKQPKKRPRAKPGGKPGGKPGARPHKGQRGKGVPEEVAEKAKEISQKTGIDLKQAIKVAKGETTVSAVLKELMTHDKAEKIQKKHGVTRNLALDVVRGGMSLDDAVLISQLHNSEAWLPNHSFLIQLHREDEKGFFQTYGEEAFTAKVTKLSKYDCRLACDDEEPKEYQKHDLLFAAHPQNANKLQSLKKIDEDVSALKLGPSTSYRDRFRSKKRVLFRLHRDETKTKVTLRDGTVFVGKIGWFGKWEFLLRVSDDCDVVIFRHSLHRIEDLDPVSPQEEDVQKQANNNKSKVEKKEDTSKEDKGEGANKKTSTALKKPKKKTTKTKKKKKKKKR